MPVCGAYVGFGCEGGLRPGDRRAQDVQIRFESQKRKAEEHAAKMDPSASSRKRRKQRKSFSLSAAQPFSPVARDAHPPLVRQSFAFLLVNLENLCRRGAEAPVRPDNASRAPIVSTRQAYIFRLAVDLDRRRPPRRSGYRRGGRHDQIYFSPDLVHFAPVNGAQTLRVHIFVSEDLPPILNVRPDILSERRRVLIFHE